MTLRLDATDILVLYGFLALGSHFGAVVAGENSQFSPAEARTYTAAISTGAASTLIDKISAAAMTAQNQTGRKSAMKISEIFAPPSDAGAHYREVAGKLRLLAHQIRLPNARREILDLAIRYDQRGHHLDSRVGATAHDPPDSG